MLVPPTSALVSLVSASGCLMHHQLHAGRGMLEAARLPVNRNRVSTRGSSAASAASSAASTAASSTTSTAASSHHAKDQYYYCASQANRESASRSRQNGGCKTKRRQQQEQREPDVAHSCGCDSVARAGCDNRVEHRTHRYSDRLTASQRRHRILVEVAGDRGGHGGR